jgi:hypothetical protein
MCTKALQHLPPARAIELGADDYRFKQWNRIRQDD